jgi:hypothetical protein
MEKFDALFTLLNKIDSNKFDVLFTLLNKIDSDKDNLINILKEIDALYSEDILPEYTLLLYQNCISLSELSNSIKEYFVSNDIIPEL